MSEDNNKLQAIMDALKKSQEVVENNLDPNESEQPEGGHEDFASKSDSENESETGDFYADLDDAVKSPGSERSAENNEDLKEDYDPLKEDEEEEEVSGEESKKSEDSEEERSGMEQTEETADLTRTEIIEDEHSFSVNSSEDSLKSDIGKGDVIQEEFVTSDKEVVDRLLEENDEKENNDDDDKNLGHVDNQDSNSPLSFDEASKVQDTDVSITKDQSIATKGDNIDHDLLQRQVNYILESEMLSLPEFQELSPQEKVVAVVTLLNSNPDTSMPTKSTNSTVTEAASRRRFPPPDMSQSMTPEERQRYAEYLRGENRITEIEHFPPKSRLFIGNLPLKNVTKEDLFRIFSPYGHIFQINIKNAFGFIQYDNAQSVRDAIECESNETNFGKKLILEVSSSNSRPQFDHGDHGTNSSSTFVTSSKRPFDEQDEEDDMYSDNHYKKTKKRIPQCMILVKRTADRSYANEVFNNFRNGSGLETDMVFLKPRMELRKLINDAAYDGVWGVILVNKTRNVDIQTFYKGPQGETKFDEYISVSCEDSIAIFNNLKSTRNGGSISPPMPQRSKITQQQARQPQQAPAPAPAPPPPQQQQQQYYGGYAIPPQQNPYMPRQQIYGTIPAAAPPPPPPPQPQQQYAPPMQPYGGFAPQQLPISAPTHTNSPMDQTQLLAAIQHLPQNVISSLLSIAQQQPNQQQQQQQVLGLLQQLQSNPQTQQAAQQLGNMTNPYVTYAAPPTQAPGVMAGSPPPQPAQTQSQMPQPPQQQKHSVSQTQSNQTGSNVQSLLDSLAQLQK